ncbi:ABC transporter ATP-binding protein [Comamonadaceae bacterium PP-2]
MTRSPESAFRKLYGALWQHSTGMHGTLVAAMSLLTASQLVRLTMPWFTAQAINALQQGDIAASARWIGLLMLVYATGWALHGPGRILERNVAVRVRETVSDQLYARLAAAPLVWHDAHHSGELQHRVHQAGRALCDFTQNQFVYLQSTVNFFGPLVALALLSTVSGGAAVAGYIVIFFVIIKFDRALMRLARDENDADRRYVSALLDFLGNASTVIGLRLQRASRRLLHGRMQAMSEPLKRSVVLNEGKWCAVDMMGLALTWGLVVIYIWQSHQPGQALLLGSVFMIYQYAQQTAAVVSTMAGNFQNFARMHTDYGSADLIWSLPAPDDPSPVAAPAPGSAADAEPVAAPLPAAATRLHADRPEAASGPAWSPIALAALDWDYPRMQDPADPALKSGGPRGGLRGISLMLHSGQRIALVGASGGGKSTLLRVLAGLYRPQAGSLRFGDSPQDWTELADIATLIPQESEIFEASVRENLTFGEQVPQDALQQALHTSAFDEVMARMENGLETPLSERGFNLSGGQRQRLNLARGLLAARDSRILLLDEPTSALDAATEAKVVDRIGLAFPQACIVASIHRLSLLERFDTLFLMEAGQLVDAGPRDDVLQRQPLLRQAASATPSPTRQAGQPSPVPADRAGEPG